MAFVLLAQSPALQQSGISFGWLFAKTILAMVIIIALAYVVIRYVFPRFQITSHRQGSNIKIIDKMGLEPRKGLYIIEVENKRAVIGTSEQSVTKIMDLDSQNSKTN